jgi:hypothetical protein
MMMQDELTTLVQASLDRDQILKELAEDTSKPSLFTDMFAEGFSLGMSVIIKQNRELYLYQQSGQSES